MESGGLLQLQNDFGHFIRNFMLFHAYFNAFGNITDKVKNEIKSLCVSVLGVANACSDGQ